MSLPANGQNDHQSGKVLNYNNIRFFIFYFLFLEEDNIRMFGNKIEKGIK